MRSARARRTGGQDPPTASAAAITSPDSLPRPGGRSKKDKSSKKTKEEKNRNVLECVLNPERDLDIEA